MKNNIFSPLINVMPSRATITITLKCYNLITKLLPSHSVSLLAVGWFNCYWSLVSVSQQTSLASLTVSLLSRFACVYKYGNSAQFCTTFVSNISTKHVNIKNRDIQWRLMMKSIYVLIKMWIFNLYLTIKTQSKKLMKAAVLMTI